MTVGERVSEEDRLIGSRIREHRLAARMTQKELADFIGVSPPMVSYWENGQLPVNGRRRLADLARALKVDEHELTGQPARPGSSPVRADAARQVPPLRTVLRKIAARVPFDTELDLTAVQAQARMMSLNRMSAAHIASAKALPGVLAAAAAHGGAGATALVESLIAAWSCLRTMGYTDLSETAANLAVRVAEEHGDPAYIGQAHFTWINSFDGDSAATAVQLAVKQADLLGPLGTQEARETYPMLHLMAALQSAVMRDADAAKDHLAEARGAIRWLEPPADGVGFLHQMPTLLNCQIWEVGVAAELEDSAAAIAAREQIDTGAIELPSRRSYLNIDYARALIGDPRNDEKVVQALREAERVAGVHFRLSPATMDLVRVLFMRRRRPSAEATKLFNILGISRVS